MEEVKPISTKTIQPFEEEYGERIISEEQIDITFEIILHALKNGLSAEDKQKLKRIIASLPRKKITLELEAKEKSNQEIDLILHTWYD
ncbi:MAG: hypothetical protein GF308_11535 [Candidatus Heimdallarchaeota archaeon]|nr:hypothetical protein [Candidatus Heimdallarchaeota archaeon]